MIKPVSLSSSYFFLLPLEISMVAIKSEEEILFSSISCQMFIRIISFLCSLSDSQAA